MPTMARERPRLGPSTPTGMAPSSRKETTHDGYLTTDFWDVLLWSFWFFIWIAALMVWFRCLMDLFRDHSLSGWAKAGWAVLLIFVPWLGALIYLIARGKSMTERQMAEVANMQAQQREYIQSVAGSSGGSAGEIASAKDVRLGSHQPGGVRRAEGQGARLS